MKLDRRTCITLLALLVFLAGLPGMLLASCGPLCPARNVMSCCHSGDSPAIKAPSCCESLKPLAPLPASRAVVPSSPVAVALAAPDLPGEPMTAAPAPEPPPSPPLLHEGIGLYTLNSVFLI
jgi:hypothetical protein